VQLCLSSTTVELPLDELHYKEVSKRKRFQLGNEEEDD